MMPALANRQSSRPNSLARRSIAAFMSPSEATLAVRASARPPAWPTSAATSSVLSRPWARTPTAHPSAARRSTVARPIPELPPVTRATLPSKLRRFSRSQRPAWTGATWPGPGSWCPNRERPAESPFLNTAAAKEFERTARASACPCPERVDLASSVGQCARRRRTCPSNVWLVVLTRVSRGIRARTLPHPRRLRPGGPFHASSWCCRAGRVTSDRLSF